MLENSGGGFEILTAQAAAPGGPDLGDLGDLNHVSSSGAFSADSDESCWSRTVVLGGDSASHGMLRKIWRHYWLL